MFTDMIADMFADMFTDMFADMFTDMFADMFTDYRLPVWQFVQEQNAGSIDNINPGQPGFETPWI